MVLYGLTTAGYLGPNPIGESSDLSRSLIVPSGYAFAIWAPIYLFLLVFPFYQWIKHPIADSERNALRKWYGVNVIANGLWLVCASYDLVLATVIIIVFMLFTLYRINVLIVALKERSSGINFWTEAVGFYAYFGWITIATVLNITGAFQYYGFDGMGISDISWALLILTVTAVIAAVVAWTFKNITYALVVLWAFLALLIKYWGAEESLAYLSVGILMFFSVLILLILRKRRMVPL